VAVEPDEGAPTLFRDELRQARELIAEYPKAGAVAEDIELSGVRRVLLVKTQHYIYYRVDESAKRVVLLAVWSTSRGKPPRIRG
jgi:plasmid stabilization system protein ParE